MSSEVGVLLFKMFLASIFSFALVLEVTDVLINIDNERTKEVYIGFYIESLGDIRATDMAFDVDMYFRRSWRDETLSHRQDLKILGVENMTNEIWVPDIYFANAKTAKQQDVTVPNMVMYVEEDGSLSFSSRIILNVACTLDLKKYPLDDQHCAIKIMSYGFPKDRLNLMWFPNDPITYNEKIRLAEFDIEGIDSEVCDQNYKYAKTKNKTRIGIFSCLQAVIHLKRSIGYHLVQTYIPTGMIVVISWVSFWIDRTAVPARVSLSFTTLLTLSTMGAGLRYSLPAVSYAKAIDYWMGMCMIFVFAALLEFAFVNSLVRRSQKYEKLTKEANGSRSTVHAMDAYMVDSMRRVAKKYSHSGLICDKICRVVFPTAFIIFNIFYWVGYYH